MNAKIKVWILTGDKQETAINIGLSTGLMTKDGPIIVINESNLKVTYKLICSSLCLQ